MDRLYIDCNILIDWLTDRPPFGRWATDLIVKIEEKKCVAFVSPLTLANTFYIIRKNYSKTMAYTFLKDAQQIFSILDIKKEHVQMATAHKFKDFEDDLHFAVAQDNHLSHLITRNKADFIETPKLIIQTAEEYLSALK